MSFFTNNGLTSTDNSSTTPLGPTATFTGIGELNNISDVMVVPKADQNGTFTCQFSVDGSNWDSTLSFNYDTARINAPHIFVKGPRYYRTTFTNTSGVTQSYLRLYTYYGEFDKLTAPINGTLAENYDAVVTRPTDYRSEVAMGKRQGRTIWNKFGYNQDVDTGTEEILGSWGGAFDPITDIVTASQTFTIAYDTTTGGGDGLGTTGALMLAITYIDEDYLTQTGVHVLSNTGTDVTSFSGLGINRAVIYTNGGTGSNANDITITATTDATTQAQIPALGSVTQQCIFHTQINHNFLMEWITLNCLKVGAGSEPVVTIKAYSWSRVTSTRYQIFEKKIDTAVENSIELSPALPFILGGREVVYFTASTTINNTAVNARFSGIEERIS